MNQYPEHAVFRFAVKRKNGDVVRHNTEETAIKDARSNGGTVHLCDGTGVVFTRCKNGAYVRGVEPR